MLKTILRGGDDQVLGDAFRVGGDEFVVAVPHEHTRAVLAAAEQQLHCVTLRLNEKSLKVGATVGYCVGTEDASLDELVKRAEKACRIAKAREDGLAVEWTEDAAAEAPDSVRRKCTKCLATTSVLVVPSRKHENCLKFCANCGEALG